VPDRRDIAVTHADAALGRRVVARLGAQRVVGLAGEELDSAELKRSLHDVDVVVHVASATPQPLDATRAVLDVAADARHLVVVTSALVYGAWPGNPVPLTEEAPLKPNPGFEPAVALGEVERLLAEWRDAHPGATVAVLRPAPPVAEDDAGWLAPMLAAARGTPVGDDDPPGQYLHLDDLADAIAVAVDLRLDGAYNVGPEGWAAGEELRALQGGPRVRLPGRVAERVVRWRWRAGVSPTPPWVAGWWPGWVPSGSSASPGRSWTRPS
jgi:nucleoside-diphosphate-sugar epimerase